MACASMPSRSIAEESVDVCSGMAFYGDSFRKGNTRLLIGGRIDYVARGDASWWSSDKDESRKWHYLIDLYKKEGTGFLDSLYGDFCLAIYDCARRDIVLVRDLLGVIPIFYTARAESLSFAPTVAAIRESGLVESRICNEKIFSFLQGSELPGYLSCFNGVYRVPASHFVYIDKSGSSRISRYVELGNGIGISNVPFKDNAEILRQKFLAAVARRMPQTGLVASEVSGGLDSSSVFSAARSLAGDRVCAISGVFPLFPSCDESGFVDDVCAKWGASSRKIDVDAQSVVESARRGLSSFQGLHNAANMHITSSAANAAVELGCKAILNGVDGDNVVSHGRHHLTELANLGDWPEFVRLTALVAPSYARYMKAPNISLCYMFGVPVLRRFLLRGEIFSFRKGFRALSQVPGVSRRHMLDCILKDLSRQSGITRGLIKGGFLKRPWQGRFPEAAFRREFLDSFNARESLRQMFPAPGDDCLTERKAHLSNFSNGVNQHYFEYTWANSAANGVRTISPFMDRELLEFCLSVPPQQKLRDGFSRAIFREAMKDLLPESILKRQWKTDLSPSVLHKVRNEVIPVFRSNLAARPKLLSGFIDQEYLSQALHLFESSGSNRHASIRVWVLFCLGEWLIQMGES